MELECPSVAQCLCHGSYESVSCIKSSYSHTHNMEAKYIYIYIYIYKSKRLKNSLDFEGQ